MNYQLIAAITTSMIFGFLIGILFTWWLLRVVENDYRKHSKKYHEA